MLLVKFKGKFTSACCTWEPGLDGWGGRGLTEICRYPGVGPDSRGLLGARGLVSPQQQLEL